MATIDLTKNAAFVMFTCQLYNSESIAPEIYPYGPVLFQVAEKFNFFTTLRITYYHHYTKTNHMSN